MGFTLCVGLVIWGAGMIFECMWYCDQLHQHKTVVDFFKLTVRKLILDPMELNTFWIWEKWSPPMFQLIRTAPLYSASSKRCTNCLVNSYNTPQNNTTWLSVIQKQQHNRMGPHCFEVFGVNTIKEPWCSPLATQEGVPAGRCSQMCLWWSIRLWDILPSLERANTHT